MRPLLCAMISLSAAAGPLAAQEEPGPPVVYSATHVPYHADADAVEFQVIVEGKGNSALQASGPCRYAVDSVVAALTRLALPSLAIDVVPQGVAPVSSQYGQAVSGERFLARSTIRVRLTDLRHLSRVTSVAFEAGATRTAMFQWSSRTLARAREVAHDSAVALARTEGERLARALGGRLGELRSANAGDDAANAGYYPGQDQSVQTIPEVRGRISVNVTWTFVPQGR